MSSLLNARLDCVFGLKKSLCSVANKSKIAGYIGTIPVVTIDVASQIVIYPIAAIDAIANTALELIKAAFSEDRAIQIHLDRAKKCATLAITSLLEMPIRVLLAPFAIGHLVYQIGLNTPTIGWTRSPLNPVAGGFFDKDTYGIR